MSDEKRLPPLEETRVKNQPTGTTPIPNGKECGPEPKAPVHMRRGSPGEMAGGAQHQTLLLMPFWVPEQRTSTHHPVCFWQNRARRSQTTEKGSPEWKTAEPQSTLSVLRSLSPSRINSHHHGRLMNEALRPRQCPR